MRFEWDASKAWANFLKHGVSFNEAMEIFYDSNALERYDNLHSDDESRFILIGLSSGRLLHVAYTERAGGTLRLISARSATGTERKLYERRMVQ